MTIPYIRQLAYFSPSSFQQFQDDRVGFYLQRLGPPEFVPVAEEEGFPAAVGTAFDAVIKAIIAGIR